MLLLSGENNSLIVHNKAQHFKDFDKYITSEQRVKT